MRLFGAWGAMVWRYDGEFLSLAAVRGGQPGSAERMVERFQGRQRPLESLPPGRVVLTRSAQHCADVETDPSATAELRAYARERGFRSFLQVPMLRGADCVGVISVSRVQAGAFSPAEIAVLQTFAAQAVIAIENARLLTDLQDRTRELTRSVDQLTALGEVGRAVSSSLDLDTVLSTILGRAVQLSGTAGGTIFEYDEIAEEFSARATLNADEGASAAVRATRLRKGEGAVGQMAVTREPFQIPDIA